MHEDDLRRIARELTDAQNPMREALASPAIRALVDQAAEQQRRLAEALASPAMKSLIDETAERQTRLREALSSPTVKALVEQAAARQKQLREVLASPTVKALIEQAETRQKQLREALSSPPVKAFLEQAMERQKQLSEALASPAMKALLDQAEARHKQLSEALASPTMKAFVEQAMERQRQMGEVLRSPAMKALLEQTAEQQRRLRETLATFGEAAARAAEAYRLWDEGEQRILDLLVPRGWLISPNTSLAEIHELLRLADEQGVDAVEEALVAALTPERCREILESLFARPSFTAWRPVLEQALSAHEQGMYALAVPVWLIALDGIFVSELGVQNVFKRVQRKRGLAVRAAIGSGTRTRLLEALVAVIRTVAANLPAGAKPSPGELRRHAIFHGLDPDYGTEKASIQGVLLLEALHFQIESNVAP